MASISAPVFDPAVHLAYQPPSKRYSMEELGLKDKGISEIGITEPFQLLSPEAVRALRADVFNKSVLSNYTVASKLASCQVRGMGSDNLAQFIHDLWSHPDTIRACSDAAGMEVVPIMPYELGHTNVQTPNRGSVKETLATLGPEPLPALVPSTESDSETESDDEPGKEPVVGWHNDSYPWVCVLMLSDASTMMGGETALQCGDGSIRKVRGPGLGYAVMMQGRYINHAALNAWYAPERVTMVTSFRAKDSEVRDDSVLTTIRPISNLDELYHQWTEYRMDLLGDRFKKRAEQIKARKPNAIDQDGRLVVQPFDKEEYKQWAEEQIRYLQTTINEIV